MAIGCGVSGNTSAKVSALQGTTLSTIVSRHGTEAGEVYAAASASAVQDVAALAEEEKVDCGLDRRPAVTYAANPEELRAVADERDAASGAGLPVEWREDDAGQPYPVSGAIWLRDQIGLQPVDYVRGLARAFERAGGQIYESTRVLSVDAGSPCEVRTGHGVVRAGQVVIATHYPILDRGLFFARLEVQRSYCIAAEIRGESPTAMAINAGSPTRSIQFTDTTIIIGGEGHSAGAAGVSAERFQTLERFAAERWDLTRPVARWSAQDPIPYDHLPMIGPRPAVQDPLGRHRLGEMGPHRRNLRRPHPDRSHPRPRARMGADLHPQPTLTGLADQGRPARLEVQRTDGHRSSHPGRGLIRRRGPDRRGASRPGRPQKKRRLPR